MMLNKMSLGAKLIITSVSVVLFCLSISNFWINKQARRDTAMLAQSEAQALGERYAQEVKRHLDEGMERASSLAAAVESQLQNQKPSRSAIIKFIKRSMDRNPDVAGYWLIAAPNAFDGLDSQMVNADPYHDETGRFIPYFYNFGKGVNGRHTLSHTKQLNNPNSDYHEFRNGLVSKLSRPIFWDVDGHLVILSSAGHVARDPADGRFVAMVGSDIYLTDLVEKLAALKPYETGSINLVFSGGLWVSHTDENLLGHPVDTSNPVYAAALPYMLEGKPFSYSAEDFTHLFVPLQIKGSPKPWTVVVNIPNSALTAASDELSVKITIMTAVVIGLLALSLMFIGAVMIRRPINRMTEVMKRLAAGDYRVSIPALSQGDEIGDMARAVLVFKENAIEKAHLQVEQEKAEEALKYQAYHDSLTGLYNRFALTNIEQDWVDPHNSPFAVMYLDLDNFKNINDAFGHACGDSILYEVANRIKQSVPEGSAIVRHGGDEFAIFVCIDEDLHLDKLAAGIVQAVSAPYVVLGMRLHIGASVGISRYPQDGAQLDPLMIAADLAMRRAKQKKNSYVFYSQDMHDGMQRKVAIEYQLRNALERDEIYMVFQPQIAADGSLFGFEALARWENEELGFVPPDQFISIAEETGFISRLGDFVIRRSCQDFAQVLAECGDMARGMSLSINISVMQFLEKDFRDKLLAVIAENGLPANRVIIEITESLFIDDPDIILPLLHDVRSTGIQISLDDFGTGYSSLAALRSLPIDELKVDKGFIDNICRIEQDANMMRTIVSIGETIDVRIVSEGVEEEQQLRLLKDMGCDVIQGYCYSRPLRPACLVRFIKGHQV